MKYDFTAASENSELLNDEKFMHAMHRIGTALANLIADSADSAARLEKFDAYAKEHKTSQTAEVHAQGMLHFGEMCTSTDTVRDPMAISQMMRLLIKDAGLATAIASGAVSLSELKEIGIEEGVITNKAVDALGRMGASSLATVAALNMK